MRTPRRAHSARVPAWGQWAVGLAVLLGADLVLRALYDPASHTFQQREAEVTGWLSLAALLLVLASKPLRLVSYRRALGLWAFGFALLHVVFSYAGVLDGDVLNLLFLSRGAQVGWAVGALALLGLLPLALTSTNGAMRRLGARWKALHRLGPWMTALAALHTAWIGVHFGLTPLTWTSVTLLLLTAALLLGRASNWRKPA